MVAALCGVLLLIAGGVVLSLRSQTPADSQVEHRGNRLIIYGHGADADLGYLPAGRYELTIDENRGGCANRVTLDGEDGTRWLDLDPQLINYKDFATTRELPGQRYSMHISSFFGGGGLGPRPTATPVSTCIWILELAPAS
jgi:hypothetical protein